MSARLFKVMGKARKGSMQVMPPNGGREGRGVSQYSGEAVLGNSEQALGRCGGTRLKRVLQCWMCTTGQPWATLGREDEWTWVHSRR
jgi:hypothetical protein